MRPPEILSSSLWRGLLPAGIAAYETHRFDHSPALFAQELLAMRNASRQRLEEFAAGRACARQALRELGIAPAALPRAADRRPVWPPDITGSITHTQGYCAAAVTRCGEIISIGIDSEAVGQLDDDMQRIICTPAEQNRLATLRPFARAQTATILFSAKEAFFKCQSGAGGNLTDFQDIELQLRDGEFVVEPCRGFTLRHAIRGPLQGRYMAANGRVFSAIAFAAS
jgi:4'-phosphopantetheinyl transferase EntD